MPRAVALLCILTLAGCAPAMQATNSTQLTLTAADGTRIAASLYDAPNAKAGILLLHMLGRDRHDYDTIAHTLQRRGYTILSIDFRGHGQSEGTRWQQMTPEEFRAMLSDAEAAAAALEERTEHLIVIGASIGANIALQLAKIDPHISAAILLSPGGDYRGVKANATDTPVPLLIVAAEDDQYSAESSRTLEEQAGERASAIILDTAGHGTRMLDAKPDLTDTLIAWAEAHA